MDSVYECLEKPPASVVNLTKEPHDIYCGRRSSWGNPFVIGSDGDREEVISKSKRYILNRLNRCSGVSILSKMKGKKLGCFCAPLTCHVDFIAELVNAKLRKVISMTMPVLTEGHHFKITASGLHIQDTPDNHGPLLGDAIFEPGHYDLLTYHRTKDNPEWEIMSFEFTLEDRMLVMAEPDHSGDDYFVTMSIVYHRKAIQKVNIPLPPLGPDSEKVVEEEEESTVTVSTGPTSLFIRATDHEAIEPPGVNIPKNVIERFYR